MDMMLLVVTLCIGDACTVGVTAPYNERTIASRGPAPSVPYSTCEVAKEEALKRYAQVIPQNSDQITVTAECLLVAKVTYLRR
jgi:hypothetical protein